MSFKNTIKKYITGLSVPQEYVCIDLASYEYPLSVLLGGPREVAGIDVTNSHVFLGYKPVIIALPFATNHHHLDAIRRLARIQLQFMKNQFDSVASLELDKIGERTFDDHVVLLFQAKTGQHSFLNSFQQVVNRLKLVRRQAPTSNISVPGHLNDQVRIAYSVPRVISVMTLANDYAMNMFPTDLHGPIGGKFYCSSLRIGGKASGQVEKLKNIVLSDVAASSFKKTYLLGKNHMQELKSFDKFQLSTSKSEKFKIPLPENVVKYRELRQFDSLDRGIHRIYFYEIENESSDNANSKLAHIHQYFAQWRLNNHLPTNLLLR